jgi:transketolase C-terminal domain/subunit
VQFSRWYAVRSKPPETLFGPTRQIGLPDEFLDAGALPTLHDRYGISSSAVVNQIKGWA